MAYVALEKGSGAKLIRASALSGTPVVTAADQIGMGTIGLLRTGQARYAVVGVDPKEPNHLLAHDIFSGTKASRDGGVNWFALPALDAAVTDTGKFTAAMNAAPFVTTIAWDPTNSCHILVGTMQNGVIRSADGGLTWAQVPGSKNATIVTSFFFPPTGPIWMSTYGRGLWQVMSSRTTPASGRCEFPQLPSPVTQPNSPVVIMRTGATPRTFTGLQDEAVCPTCTVLLANLFLAYTQVAHDCVVGSSTVFSNNAPSPATCGSRLGSRWAPTRAFASSAASARTRCSRRARSCCRTSRRS